ncbi:hypothetical protein N7532_003755 [Penicillium argentinense]|uniref:Uncharacterized protein n=1 Tax=Penicillium argentinense TaxID=1131581 RepID=A0A9W9FN08_9EURO|nr:uncharacterized protein N7532_003755 [Penicillium argentinense]KAJ5103226.1 hypothetical protein N7532_003755 [Penicillium argentinense]
MVVVSEVSNGICGVYDIWQFYCKATDAPADIEDTFAWINIRQTRLQGWITYIEKASLNEEQLLTITTSILPRVKDQIRATINEIEKFRNDTSGNLQKKTEWAIQKPIMDNRLRALDVILNEGDDLFRRHCPGFHDIADALLPRVPGRNWHSFKDRFVREVKNIVGRWTI